MPRGGAHFASEELVRVLSCYKIGVIHQVKPLSIGNRRAPKVVITAEKGRFLLKRRAKGKDDLYRVSFAHAVQNHLEEKNFPVTPLIRTADGKDTALHLNSHIYEMFRFVEGSRYNGSAEATVDAARQLARCHRNLADFAGEFKPLRGVFHDSSSVRRHLKSLGADKKTGPNGRLQNQAEALMILYNASAVRVNELGFDSWDEQVVHGDWHPGNILFADGTVIAVLDFDSVRFAPPVIDLANGLLQFSIVGDRPNPADWPDYFDQAKLVQFLNGYREAVKLDKYKTAALLDLMIETMIAEAVLPIAATGFFGSLSGLEFLQMIHRKAKWLKTNRKKLEAAMKS
ncbi:phosphotransferase enzyme family protein [Planctomycetota bacterium]